MTRKRQFIPPPNTPGGPPVPTPLEPYPKPETDDFNALPCMTLQRAYETLAAWLVERGWRRERHWFYPPDGGAHGTLEAAVKIEACNIKRGRP